MIKFIGREDIRNEILAKKPTVNVKFTDRGASGEMELLIDGSGESKGAFFGQAELARVKNLAAGEMMLPADLDAFRNQVIVDLTAGKFQYPTVFQTIYREESNPNFPRQMKTKQWIGLVAAFAKVNLGEAIPMAQFKSGILEYAEFETDACGYSILRDWILFNELWNVTNANEAMGIAYNARMDNIHLSPIIAAAYGGVKSTALSTTGDSPMEKVWYTLRQGMKDALRRRNPISGQTLKPSIAFCNSVTAMDVQAAIDGMLSKGTQLGKLGNIQTVLAYDGWSGTVNGKPVTYPCPADNKVYLIEPKNGFISFIKEERTKLTQKGNVLTLSELDVAETFTKTLMADTENGVQEVTIA